MRTGMCAHEGAELGQRTLSDDDDRKAIAAEYMQESNAVQDAEQVAEGAE